ncbi:glycosyl hydrolase [Vibrio sp. AK197]
MKILTYLVLMISVAFVHITPAYSQTIKRGIATTQLFEEDLSIMKHRISWWYNWSSEPTYIKDRAPSNQGVEFVPMALNGDFNEAWLRNYLDGHPSVQYLLGFNEPNFVDQANLTPQQAADLWPRLETIASDYGLQLVSPAVNYSPGDVDIPNTDDDGNPFEYLDAFFEACSDCQVDYIAVHAYMADPDALKQYINHFYQRYGKPVWITEWNFDAPGQTETLEQQMDYMADIVRWMDNSQQVFRYAWFVGRSTHSSSAWPYVDLLDAPGYWSTLGKLYQGIQHHDDYTLLPSVLQAEYARSLRGFKHRVSSTGPVVETQLFSDIQATKKQLTFQINTEHSEDYSLLFSYSGKEYSEITVSVDGEQQMTIPLWATGCSYYWTQRQSRLFLPAGLHSLSIDITVGNPNFDWFTLY